MLQKIVSGAQTGVDIRIWMDSDKVVESPMFIVQCKRQKSAIEKVIIKSLYADVKYENAEYGLIVTTSDLTVGSKKTIESRGYPIKVVNQDALKEWLKKLRTPGRGYRKY